MTSVRSVLSDTFDSQRWPESRPYAWHALAAVERVTRFASLFSNNQDAVLLYHSVGGVPGIDYRWDVSLPVFRDQLRQLSSRYDIVDLETIATTRDTARKRIAITFDDGFRNVYENALPVLEEFDAPATLFVNPAFIDDENIGQLRAHHDLGSAAHEVSLTTEQLREIAADDRYTIGNHTFSHADLTELPDRGAIEEEVVGAKRWLEDEFDLAVDRFSYPYGKTDARVADVVQESHDLIVTSEPALVGPSTSPRSIPRLDACLPPATVGFEVTDVAAQIRSLARAVGPRLG